MRSWPLRALGAAALMAALIIRPPAARAFTVTLVPPTLEFTAEPGETLHSEVKLFNESTEPLTLYPSTANFTAKDEAGTPNFDPQEAQVDLAAWVSVDRPSYTIPVGEKITVPVTIAVPANADPGGHYAALFFGNAPPGTAVSGIAVSSKIGALVILRVEGQVVERAVVRDFMLHDGRTALTQPPVQFDVRIQNTGNVHIRPTGTITVHNMFGGQTTVLTLNSAQGAILPNSSRLFTAAWQKASAAPPSGNFFQQVASQWRNFALGSYTATIDGTYGTSAQPLTATIHFSIFPWQLLLTLLVIIIVLIILLVIGIRRYNAMIIRRAERSKTTAGGKE